MTGQVEVLWFENMGVFSEPIFDFSVLKLTLKQVGVLFGGILFAYVLGVGVNQFAGLATAGLALLLTFYKPKVMPLERYAVAAIKFLISRRQRIAEKQNVSSILAKNAKATEAAAVVVGEGSKNKKKSKEEKGNKGNGFFAIKKKQKKKDHNNKSNIFDGDGNGSSSPSSPS